MNSHRCLSNRGKPARRLPACLAALLGLCLWLAGSWAEAEELALNPAHPDRYVVVPGDTLWDIAGRFLAHPWDWPEVWHENPHIRNPHWIYPGDELVLSMVNGKPQIEVGTPSEIRLSPRIRVSPLEHVIPTIPLNAVRQFLTSPKVVGEREIKDAPYILDFAMEHIVGGAGDRVYVRGIGKDTGDAYTVFRPGAPYVSPETGEVLGYEAQYVADTRTQQIGEVSTMLLTRASLEVRIGDRLLPTEHETIAMAFHPHAAKTAQRGHIISVLNGVSQIGQYNVVVIDQGSANGVEVGHVFNVLQKGRPSRDIVNPGFGSEVHLPDEKAGYLMVFRPFERVSYALVMQANRNIHVADLVLPP